MNTRILQLVRRVARRRALRGLRQKAALWHEIAEYRKKSPSTGCSWSDLWVLYRTVRDRRPRECLELGPGLSTVVLAYALMENEREGYPGRITALEEVEFYLEASQKLLPPYLVPFVDFVHSPRVEYTYELFRGVGYRDVPPHPYDFVFVDGPDHHAPSDGEFAFDFDLLSVVRRSKTPVYAIVDYRLTSCFVFQSVFGTEKARFDAILELGLIGPCTKEDMLPLSLSGLTASLMRNARVLGNTEIRLR